jgi:excisionase family DNA binding protein
MEGKLFTTEEVAAYLRIEPAEIDHLVQSGELQAYRVGDSYRFADAHIRDYLAAHELPKVDPGNHEQQAPKNPLEETSIEPQRLADHWKDDLWAFLNQHEVIAKMCDASNRGRPAAESIASDLLSRFGSDVKQNEVKKHIGRLIKRVMEENGFKHARRGERCRQNPVFSVASTYRQVR